MRLRSWIHPAILATALLAAAAGFAQFGVTAALGDVARAFGKAGNGPSISEQIGLSLTTLGIGLGVIRLASVGSLPLTGLADRMGRRRVILICCLGGLAFTIASAASPSYWWFIAVFALGRPLLSTTNALAAVIAAEQTRAADRAKAVALIAAAYAMGAGAVALVRGIWGVEFRTLFALSIVPLLLVAVLGRLVQEPDRYALLQRQERKPWTRPHLPGAVPTRFRARLALLASLGFAAAFVTGPATTLLFVYVENVLGLAPSTAAWAVPVAGLGGLAGLVLGRWAADRIGRVPTLVVAQAGIAIAGALTYSAGIPGAIGGYIGSISAQAALGPAIGVLGVELFPTSTRASAAGWFQAAGVLGAVAGLITFSLLVDVFGSFTPAALAVTIPVALSSAAYLFLPETRGLELEQSAPEE